MKVAIVDARSGRRLNVGDTVDYADGSGVRLIDAQDWGLAVRCKVDSWDGDDRLRVVAWLPIRWYHPAGAGELRTVLLPT